MGHVLEVNDLHAGYDGSFVLHGVSFAVGPGEIVALLGRNGMGKSTLVNTLSGSIQASQGSLILHGEEVTNAAASSRYRSGLRTLRQDQPVFPELTVGENLAMVGSRGQSRAGRLFDFMRMRSKQIAGSLSGGEQKLLAMARTATSGGTLWVLDEPTEGLQPANVELCAEIITEAAGAGCGVLLVEQHLTMALQIASRWMLMEKGVLTDGGQVDVDTHEHVHKLIAV